MSNRSPHQSSCESLRGNERVRVRGWLWASDVGEQMRRVVGRPHSGIEMSSQRSLRGTGCMEGTRENALTSGTGRGWTLDPHFNVNSHPSACVDDWGFVI